MSQLSSPLSSPLPARGALLTIVSIVAVVFGLATIRAGGLVLIGNEAARQSAGDYVPFVLWFNFLAGFLYVAAGIGLWLRRRWAVWLAAVIAAGTLVVYASFGIHIANGGLWERRTLAALTLRSTVWVVIAAIAWRRLRDRGSSLR